MNTITLRTKESLVLDLDDAYSKIEKLLAMNKACGLLNDTYNRDVKQLRINCNELKIEVYDLRNRRD